MYQRASDVGLGFTLPKWLTPPKAIRDVVTGAVGSIIKQTQVTVPTPGGTVVFTGSQAPVPATTVPVMDAGGVNTALLLGGAALAAFLLLRKR